MNDGEALYAAILDRPEDNTPRLIYADWLESNGKEAQAKFIRDQIESGDVVTHPDNKETAVDGIYYTLRRGFTCEAVGEAGLLSLEVGRIVEEHPIERLTFNHRDRTEMGFVRSLILRLPHEWKVVYAHQIDDNNGFPLRSHTRRFNNRAALVDWFKIDFTRSRETAGNDAEVTIHRQFHRSNLPRIMMPGPSISRSDVD